MKDEVIGEKLVSFEKPSVFRVLLIEIAIYLHTTLLWSGALKGAL